MLCYFIRDSRQKYWVNRPIFSILSQNKVKTLKQLNKFKNENAVIWWKYAISSVIKNCKEKKTRISQFDISFALEKYYQRIFTENFVKMQMGSKDSSVYFQKIHEKIILIHPQKTLNQWAKEGIYQIEKNKQQEAKKENKGGFFGWGAPVKKEKPVTLEEQMAQIFTIIRQEIMQGKLDEVKGEIAVYLSGSFVISQGKFKLYHIKDKLQMETIKLQIKRLSLNIKHRTDGEDLDAKVGNVELVGVTKPGKEVIPLVTMSEQGEDYLHYQTSLDIKDSFKFLTIALETVILFKFMGYRKQL